MKNPFSKKAPSQQEAFLRTYLDCIAPGIVKFEVDHYIFGSTYRCVWALREYPASTEAQALLRELGEKSGVTLRIYCRQVSPGEEDRIIDNANKKNKLDGSDPNKLRQAVAAESNLRDVAELVHKMHREHEPLVHCAVYLEMTADSKERLRQLQTDVLTELVRCKLNVDKLLLRQKQGFCCVSPVGSNMLGREFERVLPASSVANLYPFNYSGKTDPNGFYIGKDKYGSNIVVDFDRRDSDKTSANILILGNSGQGKSYLIKLLICNLLEAGKSVIALDAEHELEELCENLGGCFIDLMAGEKRINVLEVRSWNEDADSATDETVPEAFRKSTLLARHISFLKDFFRAYKDFSDPQLDTIEIMLSKLYARWGITEETDFRQLAPEDYPILSDLYDLMQEELAQYKPGALYTQELLQEVLLALHSLCVGADAPFFNGHTNISGDRFLVFGVGGVLTAAKSLRNALLFNVLAYMSDRLLTGGNTVAVLDELYLWLSNPVAIEYIRNCLKRVRKRDSALVMASQNLEDFDQEGVREMTKPLFAIPPHQFLFNPGSIGKRFYMDMLQLDEAEFELIQRARRGECLYKCGMEEVYVQLSVWRGRAVTAEERSNAVKIYSMVMGSAGGGTYNGAYEPGGNAPMELEASLFTDPATKNSADLAIYAANAWNSGWGYVWGTFGQVLTPELLQYKISQYPEGVGDEANFIRSHWLNRRTTDCVGLIKGYGWLNTETMEIQYGSNGMPDVGADGMYYNAGRKGSIETMPDTPGLAVWKSGHIGVYIGSGEVIEAMDTRYGVVKTKLQGRGWSHWLEVPGIKYD